MKLALTNEEDEQLAGHNYREKYDLQHHYNSREQRAVKSLAV